MSSTITYVTKELDDIASRYNVDEFLIQTPVATYEQREQSLRLLSELNVRQSQQFVKI